jgi:hypothetical protein
MTAGDLPVEVLEALQANEFSVESRLYRFTLPEFLTPANEDGACHISANPKPEESVRDIYNAGLTIFSKDLPPGLTFARTRDNQWQAEDRVAVELRLGDILEGGGRLYPVEFFEDAFYLTFPGGSAPVRRLR